MSIDAQQIRNLVIKPVLHGLGDLTPCKYSEAAEELLLGTAATESLMGRYIKQHPSGPALGIFQIEPSTAHSILDNYVHFRPDFKSAIGQYLTLENLESQLVTNLALQTVIARLVYWIRPEPMPKAGDIHELGNYWKNHYNTRLGKGTADKFVADYARYVR